MDEADNSSAKRSRYEIFSPVRISCRLAGGSSCDEWKCDVEDTDPVVDNGRRVLESIEYIMEGVTCPSLSLQETFYLLDTVSTDLDHDVLVLINSLLKARLARTNVELEQTGDDSILNKVLAAWHELIHLTMIVQSVCSSMEQRCGCPDYIRQKIFYQAFRNDVVQLPVVQERVLENMLRLFQLKRDGNSIDDNLLKGLTSMFEELQIYNDTFEPLFLSTSRELFERLGHCAVKALPMVDYLNFIWTTTNTEATSVNEFIRPETRASLVSIIENELIARHIDVFFGPAMDVLLADAAVVPLGLVHSLLARVPTGLDRLLASFTKHIMTSCQDIMNSSMHKSGHVCVKNLIALKDKLEDIVTSAFNDAMKFRTAVKDCLAEALNPQSNKIAELTAGYFDHIMRMAKDDSDQSEQDLDKAMSMFRLLTGKDVFEAFYRRHLGKRLLFDHLLSVDYEISVLERLKNDCGAQFTQKMEAMFHDIEGLGQLMDQYKDHSPRSADYEVKMYVLSRSNWPVYENYILQLLPEFGSIQTHFTKFYKAKHDKRCLCWNQCLGNCIVLVHYSSWSVEVQLSLVQVHVLLMFQNRDTCLVGDIMEKLEISLTDLSKTLVPLTSEKSPLLLTTNEDITMDDMLTFNLNYKPQSFHVRLGHQQFMEDEKKVVFERIGEDRHHQIDAAIMRTLKSEQSVNHTDLMSKLVSELKFSVETKELKKRVESLIDRDFVKRSEENSSVYQYVA